MSKLQKANLGVAPSGAGGDDQRAANMRFNANVDVLRSHLPLEYDVLTDDTVIESGRVGTRFGVVMKGEGKWITFPKVSSVDQNASIHIFNLGPKVNLAMQPGDGSPVSILNNGDWAEWAADGGAYWHIVRRGRLLWNEIVGGDLEVGGSLKAATMTLAGGARIGGGISTGVISFNQGLLSGQVRVYNNPGEYNVVFQSGAPGQETWAVFGPDGVLALPNRPRWLNGLVPFDTGNFDPSGKLNVAGRKDGVAPSAGNVGEIVSQANSSISLPGNRSPVATASLNLAPGEWDVQGNMIFNYNASGVMLTMAFVGVSVDAGSIPLGQFSGVDGMQATGWSSFTTPEVRVRFDKVTTVYMNAQAAANANVPCYGKLTARRVAA